MIHDLLERAQRDGNPVIDGDKAIFVWAGDWAPHLIGDLNDAWEEKPIPLKPVAPGVWAVTIELPCDAYVEYAFINPETGERFADPFNVHRTYNGLNAYNNFFYMPEGGPSPFVQRGEGVKAGRVTKHAIKTDEYAAGGERTVYFYKPPVKGPVPLLVVYDGPDYLRRGKLAEIVDNLIAQKRIHPLAMALLQNGRQARMLEYGCSDVTLSFVMDRVWSLAKKHLKLLDIDSNPGAHGVLGASMGGLQALYTGLRLPYVFGNVLSQSGAFRISEHTFITTDMVRYLPTPDLRVWMDCGKFEWLAACNREMNQELIENGYRVSYREYSGGHNYTSWRNDIGRGLEELFG